MRSRARFLHRRYRARRPWRVARQVLDPAAACRILDRGPVDEVHVLEPGGKQFQPPKQHRVHLLGIEVHEQEPPVTEDLYREVECCRIHVPARRHTAR